jgi:hypothetical protein
VTTRPQQLAEVLLGVAGIWFIASAIPGLTMFVGFFTSAPPVVDIQERNAYLWFGFTQLLLNLATGGLLLCLRRGIASRFFSDTPRHAGESGPMQAAAFAVVGVLLLTEGLASTLEHLFFLASSTSGLLPSFVGDLAKLALGVALFAGSPALATYWQRLRSTGRPSSEA